MTQNEQKTIDNLCQLISNQTQEFRESISKVDKKASSKIKPYNLERDILQSTQQAIQKSISDSLSAYNSPLVELIRICIKDHTLELKDIINESFESVIRTDEFKQGIREAFSHKVARTIIGNQQGLFEKVSNELKQDAIFKAKISIAVANVVNECLEGRAKNV